MWLKQLFYRTLMQNSYQEKSYQFLRTQQTNKTVNIFHGVKLSYELCHFLLYQIFPMFLQFMKTRSYGIILSLFSMFYRDFVIITI